jgi:hypothetical protein
VPSKIALRTVQIAVNLWYVLTMEDMIYGRATVEVVERPGYQGKGEVVEQAPFGNIWVRHNVFSFTRHRNGGWSYVILESGATGWTHEDNVRSFVRLDDVEYKCEETRSELLAGQRD